jgi:hypothetical protein
MSGTRHKLARFFLENWPLRSWALTCTRTPDVGGRCCIATGGIEGQLSNGLLTQTKTDPGGMLHAERPLSPRPGDTVLPPVCVEGAQWQVIGRVS